MMSMSGSSGVGSGAGSGAGAGGITELPDFTFTLAVELVPPQVL